MEGRTPNRRGLGLALVLAAAVAPFLALATGWTWYVEASAAALVGVAAGHLAGLWLPRAAAAASAVVVTGALVVADQLIGTAFHWLDDAIFYLVLVGGATIVGTVVTARSRQVARLERLQEELVEQQRTEAAAARLDEQSRVEREVHAGLTERIAGIAVRAEGALSADDRSALPVIESEARAVLDELRDTLGSMRAPTSHLPHGTEDAEEAEEEAPPRARPAWSDVVLAAVIGAAMSVETVVVSHSRGPAVANVLLALLAAAPLVVRRRHPIASATLTLVVACAMSTWLTPLPSTVTGIALIAATSYTVGAWCRRREWLLGWAVVAAGLGGMMALADTPPDLEAIVGVLLMTLVAVGLGREAAGWHARARRTEALVEELKRGRGTAVQLAMARERESLAGHLHDTVAHAMTVVCLHAAAGVLDADEMTAALRTIAATTETSLAELREGIEALESVERPLEPTRIAALGRRMGVEVSVVGPPVGVAATGLAYRVIREGIVNVARHAPGASATVTVHQDEMTLEVEVRDSGARAQPVRIGTGTGLHGLAQAVDAAGGTMTWGSLEEGGYLLAARLPTTVAVRAVS